MRRVKLGLIGLGYIGKTHLRNCLKLRSAELVAVSDISKKALAFARKMGIKKTFYDFHQLLRDDEIDAVIIALPTHLHAICAEAAAEAGKHIFLEKPIARNIREGKEIVQSAKKSGASLMVGYPLRFVTSFTGLKKKILQGDLGEVQTAYALLLNSGPFFHRANGLIPSSVPSWWFSKELTGGGALLDQGSHLVNLLRWYFGEVKDVKSYIGYRFNLEVEDHAVSMLKFQSRQVATVNVGWYSLEDIVRVELYGTVKHLAGTHNPSSKIISAVQMLGNLTPKYDMPYLRELQHLVDSIISNAPPFPSGDDALKDLETISMAYANRILV